ncbi:22372_t:CDS:2 [Cetraspora pellucida]|uniref:22372_t:CDS:1 n=1 Tax=Cetraspora pellucida TaxID=1433469 RepID=A0A9N8VTM2_9GLOM|nr:22372_t:CDS:2 [Cetraspora pellucida]
MTTEISNLGQISLKSTVVCTKKEVAALQLDSNKPKSYNIFNYESRFVLVALTQKIQLQPVITSKIKEIHEKLKDKKISNYEDKNTKQDENTGIEAAKLF